MKLLDRVRHTARVQRFSRRTEDAYAYWIERYIRYHGIRHPDTMGEPEIEAFLTHLAVQGRVAASTQNQAFAALLFLYQVVLGRELGRLDAVRTRRPVRVPTVLSVDEVRSPSAGRAGPGYTGRSGGRARTVAIRSSGERGTSVPRWTLSASGGR